MRDRRSLAVVTGVTERTLGKVETGRRVSASTLGALDNHLQWSPGSCRQVLAGGEPVVAPGGVSLPHYDDPTLQHIAEVPGLPPDVVRGLRWPATGGSSRTSRPMSPASRRAAGPDPPRAQAPEAPLAAHARRPPGGHARSALGSGWPDRVLRPDRK